MEFWGVEVKSGQPLSVDIEQDKVLHLSQACLGEVKDKSESVCLFVEVEGKKLVLGTLTPEKLPQQLFDLVFDKDFVISHNWKHGSIYFYGYIADQPFDKFLAVFTPEDEFGDESDSEDEAIPLQAAKTEAQPKQEKKAPVVEKANAVKDTNGKQKVKIVEPSKEADSDDSMSDDDSDDSMSEDDGSDLEGDDSEDDSDDSADDDSEDDEETPKKVQSGKKRPSESANKTPVADKKAKLVTPQKTDGKKGGGHVATPHPSKQAGKTPATSNQKSPKSGAGSVSCQSCKKNFNSEVALSSHNKAKHSATK